MSPENTDKNTDNIKIGLEIHVPLKTNHKLFCNCPTNYYDIETPNTSICEVCTGMPGAKPYPINKEALKTAVMIAKLLNSDIPDEKIYVKRKHYNYPDLPSGYQRTSEPVGVGGSLEGVNFWEMHFEEDPGRYDLESGKVDYNRSGVALIEIVTAPDMKSPEQARNFLKELINLLKYTERIIDIGGVMRADCNISLEGGAKVEIKNINSIRGMYKALKYEIVRQKNIMRRGGKVVQETRGFNEKSMVTISQRLKETADDYRYIPDPDIPPLSIDREFIEKIELPETPQIRKARIVEHHKIAEKYAKILVKDKDIADIFEDVVKLGADSGTAAQWITREVLRQLNYRGIELTESKLNSRLIYEVLDMIRSGEITENVAKKLIERVIDSGESPKHIVKKENLGKVSGEDTLSDVVDLVVSENEKAVSDYLEGSGGALNFLVGQVMRKMKGAADHAVVIKLLKDKLDNQKLK